MKLLVITPTLGTSRFLGETCASVRAIAVQHRHMLVCPREAMEELRSRFPSCDVVAESGAGLYGALNAGLESAEDWDWFTYINDDDRLGCDFSCYAEAHFKTGDDWLAGFGDVRLLDDAGRKLGMMSIERDARRWVSLLDAGISPVSQQGMLFSRRVVKGLAGYNERWRLCGDQDFWLRALRAGVGFRHYSGEAGCFRIRRGQLSGDVQKVRAEMAAVTRVNFPEGTPRLERIAAWWRFRMRNGLRVATRLFFTRGRTNARLLTRNKTCAAAGHRLPVLINGIGCLEAGSRGVLRELVKAFPPGRRAWLVMPMANREDFRHFGENIRVVGLSHRVFGRWLRPFFELGVYLLGAAGCFSRIVNLSSYGWCARGQTPTVLYFHNALLVEGGCDRWMDGRGRPNGLKRWYLDTCLRRTEKMVVQSDHMAERLAVYAMRRGMCTTRIEVVRPLLAPSGDRPRVQKSFAFQFFYPASGFAHKRVELAIHAARLAHLEDPRIGLVITSGPATEAAAPGVRLIGAVSYEVAMGHFVVSDALLFTSSLETLALPLLEAMHFGLPAVLPSLPYARDVYGDAGVYFTNEDASSVAAAMLACAREHLAYRARVKGRREYEWARASTWAAHWEKFGVI